MSDYETVGFIHSGGFGIVERVRDAGGRVLARKTFDPTDDIADGPAALEKARRRFKRETQIQAGLKHDHIMPVVAHGLADDPPWYVMPLADETLRDQIKRDRAASSVTLAPLLHILAGLEELHRLGFVHRDLKPANVLRVGERWVISDLGLVLPRTSETTKLTSTDSAWGSEQYAAPEQMTGFSDASPQADIYAFGCILHDLIRTGGRIPYSQVRTVGPLGPIVERCTEADPDDRFPDIPSLRNALVAALGAYTTVATRGDVQIWLDQLQTAPELIARDMWGDILHFLENQAESQDAHTLLLAVDLPQLEAAHAIGTRAFERLAIRLARWTRDENFLFEFCDVLGARLWKLYELGSVRVRAEATMAAFTLGYRHNRWSVMRLFVRMASLTIDDDLADRLAVEMCVLGWQAVYRFSRIMDAIGANPAAVHPKIRAILPQIEEESRRHR